jgi:uncharacterized protein YecE (DUF72 family)
MFHVGTSGYSYDDWVGPFYPPGTPRTCFLPHYAQHFRCVEVNYTYYRMPTAATLGAMCRNSGPGFRFVVKLPGDLTHERKSDAELFEQFRSALTPMLEEQRLGGVLAQFPFAFRPGPETRQFLETIRGGLEGLPVIVEFRNSAWLSPATFDLLRGLGLGYCCVDEPQLRGLMPPLAEVTSGVGYLRFHGRNAARWFEHEEAWERYNYLYSREELGEWVDKARRIADQSQEAYAFFNNHYNAQAVQNASLFVDLLEEAGIPVAGGLGQGGIGGLFG